MHSDVFVSTSFQNDIVAVSNECCSVVTGNLSFIQVYMCVGALKPLTSFCHRPFHRSRHSFCSILLSTDLLSVIAILCHCPLLSGDQCKMGFNVGNRDYVSIGRLDDLFVCFSYSSTSFTLRLNFAYTNVHDLILKVLFSIQGILYRREAAGILNFNRVLAESSYTYGV